MEGMKHRILIVEDESVVALHMESVLRRLGCEVVGRAATAKEALALAESRGCDLLLADIRLAEGDDGVAVADAIWRKCGCSVVFVTAHRDDRTLSEVAKLPIHGFLSKPFREEDLEAAVRLAALRRSHGNGHRIKKIDDVYSFCFDCDTLYQEGEKVELTQKEKRFVRALLQSAGGVLSHESLDRSVWGEIAVDANARRQLVHRFKRKVPYFPFTLLKGRGYRLDA